MAKLRAKEKQKDTQEKRNMKLWKKKKRQKNSRMNAHNESKQSSESYLYERIHVARKNSMVIG